MNPKTNSPTCAARHGPLTRGLGWFSIVLGIAEIAMPRKIARSSGSRQGVSLVRLYGMREIGTGVGILTSRDAAPWLWARVGGDMLDMATVIMKSSRSRAPLMRTATTLANLAAVTLIDVYAAREFRPAPRRQGVDYPDYSDRSGFPRPIAEVRGSALPYESS